MPRDDRVFYYPAPWLLLSKEVLDVAIIGAGQSGLAIAHALRRAGIENLALFDQAGAGGQGIWQSVARMRSLRTEKTITGPELGNPLLSFRHWHGLTCGPDAFETLDKIPRLMWQHYLDWFALQTEARPFWQHRLEKVEAASPLVLYFDTPEGKKRILARRLVIAGGMDGFGAAYIPQELRQRLDPAHLRHTQDPLDRERDFAGKRLLVLGGSASAFDAAATALEAGASEVVQLTRNPQLAVQPPLGDLRDVIAATRHFHLWPEAERWSHTLQRRARGTAPPHSVARAKQWPNYTLREGVGSAGVSPREGGGLSFEGRPFDLLIAGTGYRQGAGLRAEYRDLAPLIRQWGDLGLPHRPEDAHWGGLPYLGTGFQLLPKDPHQSTLSRIHVFTFAAILSHGFHVGDIASAQESVPRLVSHLSEQLFLEGRAAAKRESSLCSAFEREEV